MLGTRIGYNDNPESKASTSEEWKAGFLGYCKAGFDGYMQALTDKPYFFDKSRAWGPYYSLLEMLVERLVDRNSFRRRHGIDLLEQLTVRGLVPGNLTNESDLMMWQDNLFQLHPLICRRFPLRQLDTNH